MFPLSGDKYPNNTARKLRNILAFSVYVCYNIPFLRLSVPCHNPEDELIKLPPNWYILTQCECIGNGKELRFTKQKSHGRAQRTKPLITVYDVIRRLYFICFCFFNFTVRRSNIIFP